MVCIEHDRKFAQTNPRQTCKSASFFKSKASGHDCKGKCRDPRCSLECNRNWSRKTSACLSHHLMTMFDRGRHVYRGNLMPAKGQDPRTVIKAFLKQLSKWRTATGHVIEMFRVVHVTAVDKLHWDIVVWSDADPKPLSKLFSGHWKGRWSLLPVDSREEAGAAARYAAKPVKPVYPGKGNPAYLLVPASVYNIHACRPTNGFWGGSSMDEVWEQVKAGWLAEGRLIDKRTKTPPSDPDFFLDGDDLAA